MSEKKEFCRDDITRLTKAIGYVIRVYYGLNVDNIDADLIRVTIQTIISKHPNITFEELNLSYSERVIEKRQGVSLTRDELMQPIEDMTHKKGIVNSVIESERAKFEEKANEEQVRLKFKEEAMQLYVECLTNGTEWTGTPFQAATFAENFADLFTREEKDTLWNECVIEKQRADIEAKAVKDAVPKPTARHLFCQEIVKRALKRGMNGYNLIKD